MVCGHSWPRVSVRCLQRTCSKTWKFWVRTRGLSDRLLSAGCQFPWEFSSVALTDERAVPSVIDSLCSVKERYLAAGKKIAPQGKRGDESHPYLQACQTNMQIWEAVISAHASHGQDRKVISLYQEMLDSGVQVRGQVYVTVLKACANLGALKEGSTIHAQVRATGHEADVEIGNTLVSMYVKCGSLDEARFVFDKLLERSPASWAVMVGGYARQARGHEALELFSRMQFEGIGPNNTIFASVFKACGSIAALDQGRQLHAQLIQTGAELDVIVGSSLIDMYAKCGSLDEAHAVFDNLVVRNVVTWTALIAGYVRHGHGREALDLFEGMRGEGVEPNKVTFVSMLKACGSLASVQQGRQIHSQLKMHGLELDVVLGSTLVDMYAKCGSMKEAETVFNILPVKNVVSWTAMLAGYSHHGQAHEAIQLFLRMQKEGMQPTKITFIIMLKTCGSIASLEEGRKVHAQLRASTYISDLAVGNALVCMYTKCGSLEDALDAFEQMPVKDVSSWTALLAGYFEHGYGERGFQLLKQMQEEGMKPSMTSFTTILKSCVATAALDQGRQIHTHLIRAGLENDIVIGTSLVDLYAKCGSLAEARNVFDKLCKTDVVLWNTIIGGYAQGGKIKTALDLFAQMSGYAVQPNEITYVNLLKGCGGIANREKLEYVHTLIRQSGLESSGNVGSILVDMYSKYGMLDVAQEVFDSLLEKRLVSWTAMIGGYAQHGHGQEALHLFQEMLNAEVEPDKVTFVSILKACSSIAALAAGRAIHDRIIKRGFETDVYVGSTLLDMYAKCGCFNDAQRVFAKLVRRSVVSWNAMIGACAQHGHAHEALGHVQQMQQEGVKPNDVTFVNVLVACSHAGLLAEGFALFQRMLQDFGITPGIEHKSCIVDLLCRAGHLQEAENLMLSVPEADAMMWLSVLRACRTHGEAGLGRRSFEAILRKDPQNLAAHVLMCSIYADSGRWEEEAEVRKSMAKFGFSKEPGRTWIEVDDIVHSFMAHDREHCERRNIYAILTTLTEEVRTPQHRRVTKAGALT